jgi:hypothetical protein
MKSRGGSPSSRRERIRPQARNLRGSTERITMRGVVRSVSPIHFGSALEKCLNPAA